MTPEELAEYRNEKLAKEEKEAQERRRIAEIERIKRESEEAAAKAVIDDKIVPFLDKVQVAMGGELTFRRKVDTGDWVIGLLILVDGRRASIDLYGSGFQLYTQSRRPSHKSIPFRGIRSAADVTDERLGQFIKFVLDSE